ncbi:Transcription regulator LuxR, C-terminal [Candidatus Nanopelagicaceae bacterium]
MSQIRKFIEWMSFHPSTEEIARALATDYLSDYSVQGIRFGRINSDDSIHVLGQYGYPDADAWRNRVIPSAEWRAVDSPDVKLIASASKEKWTPNSLMHVNSLRDHGVIQGYLIVEFANPVSDSEKQKIADAIDDLCVPIALYLSFQSRGASVNIPGIAAINDSRDSGAGQLSARQLSILRGMVEGKTNHELATEMGFSVSTIRHETMRIYQALAVSDRKEAAKKALMLSLI